MMKIIFISLFPDFFSNFQEYSIIKKAKEKNQIKIEIIDLKKFGIGKRKQVDDYQAGPGRGMVLMIEPLFQALEYAKTRIEGQAVTILLSARGKIFNQEKALFLAEKYQTLILISGNYEGVDERIVHYIDYEISVGNYILTGGEIPSLIVANSIIRLLEGVIHPESKTNESFMQNLLDYPVYTKPYLFDGYQVPPILLTGHHQKISSWRRKMALLKTYQNNSELFKKVELSKEEAEFLKKTTKK